MSDLQGSGAIMQSEGHYREIYERCGVPEEFRGPDHYRFEKGNEGTWYAVPNEIDIEGNSYILRENGAAVSIQASCRDDLKIGSRSVVESGAILDYGVEIGKKCLIGSEVFIGKGARLGDEVEIGSRSEICAQVKLDNKVEVGQHVRIYDEADIGHHVGVGDSVKIGCFAVIREYVKIDNFAQIGVAAVLEEGVKIGKSAQVEDEALIGFESTLLPGVKVRSARSIRPKTLVYGKSFRRARKSD